MGTPASLQRSPNLCGLGIAVTGAQYPEALSGSTLVTSKENCGSTQWCFHNVRRLRFLVLIANRFNERSSGLPCCFFHMKEVFDHLESIME